MKIEVLEQDIIDKFVSRLEKIALPKELKFAYQGVEKLNTLIKISKIPDHYAFETGKDVLVQINPVYYDAVELYSQKRDEFQLKISKSIEADFQGRGLILDQLLVRNIALPAMVKGAIEEKIKAEQEAQKMQFVLQKEKQEAERKRVEAQGIADYQKIINTGLTKEQLQYEMIKAYKELSVSANSKVIVMGDKNSQVLINSN